MKGIFFAVIFALALGAQAQVPPKAALDTASGQVLALAPDAVFSRYEERGSHGKLYFRAEGGTYEAKYDLRAGRLRELEFEGRGTPLAAKPLLSAEEVAALAARLFPDAQNVSARLKQEKRGCKYDVRFSTPLFRAEAEFNPATGELCEFDLEFF